MQDAAAMRIPISILFVTMVACGGDDTSTAPDGGGDGGPDVDAAVGCLREPKPADRTRYIVVAHPYTASSGPSTMYEVIELSATGALMRFSPPRMFSLGARSPFGVIAFTPDGDVGLVAMDNGRLGVFRLDPDGMPTVVDPSFSGAFYASRVIMDPGGDRAWVVDRNTRENGGGVYLVTIGCDGTVADRGLIAAARSPGGLAFVNGRAVLAARDVLDSPTSGTDVHLLEWTNPPTLVGGGDAFGDDNQITSGFALARDGKTFFLGDSTPVGPDRVAIVGVNATGIAPITVVPGISDPSGIATSPHGDVVLVTSSQPPGEGIYVLDTGGPNGTWRNRGEITYRGPAAELPGDVVTIDRGQLAGTVLVSELTKVRRVVFHSDGRVEDLGALSFGDGVEHIAGAIGVTP